ncbi:hypothetical protein [Hydrogenophaga sp.]|uniref:hypothetical protein n=1 Tax=Hydrogenophaga sp. TaxID=1904254 RepID=UPI002637D74E|nr:hypothetical protein [Hydrogenophaga sp.]MDM7950277.1 hypothetical protein [Hydrogenophaga sp.]
MDQVVTEKDAQVVQQAREPRRYHFKTALPPTHRAQAKRSRSAVVAAAGRLADDGAQVTQRRAQAMQVLRSRTEEPTFARKQVSKASQNDTVVRVISRPNWNLTPNSPK